MSGKQRWNSVALNIRGPLAHRNPFKTGRRKQLCGELQTTRDEIREQLWEDEEKSDKVYFK